MGNKRKRYIKNTCLISGFGNWVDCGAIYYDGEACRVEFVLSIETG